MIDFSPGAFFDLENFDHAELFDGSQPVWSARR